MNVQFKIKDFVFKSTILKHYYLEQTIGYLNEIEHLALVNFIIANKLKGFYFYNHHNEKITINSDGTYSPSFEGYGEFENLLSDNISIKNEDKNAILNYNYRCNIKNFKTEETLVNEFTLDANLKPYMVDIEISDLEVGNCVSVTNYMECYDNFDEAFKFLGMKNIVQDYTSDIFIVKRIVRHPDFKNMILVYIKNINDEDCLIGIGGIQKNYYKTT